MVIIGVDPRAQLEQNLVRGRNRVCVSCVSLMVDDTSCIQEGHGEGQDSLAKQDTVLPLQIEIHCLLASQPAERGMQEQWQSTNDLSQGDGTFLATRVPSQWLKMASRHSSRPFGR